MRISSKYFSHLRSPDSFNKVVVSLFIETNNLSGINNRLIQENILTPDNTDFDIYMQIRNQLYKNQINFGFTEIIELFEYVIPKEEKSKNGIVYTPKFIKQYIIENVFKENKNISGAIVGDLSCGCGGFLYTAAKFINEKTGKKYSQIYKENIYGLDLTSYSIERVKILLSLLAILNGEDQEEFKFNLVVGNALNFNWFDSFKNIKENSGFDIIIGNPPYVTARKIQDESKALLDNWSVSKVGNTDLYIVFFEIALRFLKKDGKLGYITVNTFYRSLNARILRKYFQDNLYSIKIIDFGHEQVFSKKSTYTCLFFLEKICSDSIKFAQTSSEQIRLNKEITFNSIFYISLDFHRGWILGSENIIKNLRRIENTGHSLGTKYKIRTGLATLKNDIYIFTSVREDANYYYRKDAEELIPIEKEICRPVINANKINGSIKQSRNEKIIFPYNIIEGKLNLISEQTIQNTFPKSFRYLSSKKDILKTRDKGKRKYMQWYAFGRTQSLVSMEKKLLIPHIASKVKSLLIEDEDLLFYNGQAIHVDKMEERIVLKKLLESDVFWYYIKNISRPYSGGFYSFSKGYIKNFGVVDLSDQEKEFVVNCSDSHVLNNFFNNKYRVNL